MKMGEEKLFCKKSTSKLCMQEVKRWKRCFTKELSMPTRRMIQLAVPSRLELYIASHLVQKTNT